MTYALDQYAGDGATTTFSITFPYISTTHVQVTVDGTVDNSVTFPTATTVQTSTTPGAGVVVEVRRVTPRDSLVDFTDTGTLTETDLDLSKNQLIYLVQEQLDTAESALILSSTGNYDADNRRIVNLANPTGAQDAVTLNYLNTTYVTTLNSYTTAAATSATNAATSETNAATSATNSAASATSSATSATNSANSATSSASSATAAASAATAAAASAAEAATSAAQAEGQLSYTAKSASFTISDTGDAFQGRYGVTAGAAIDISIDGAYTPADGDWFEIWDIDDTFADYAVRLVLDNTEFFDPEGGTFTHVVLDFKTNKGIANFRYVFAYDGGAAKWKKV